MNIPNIPTDNLYKFIALSGVVVFLFFNIYPGIMIREVHDEIAQITTEQGELKLEVQFLEARKKELEDDIADVRNKLSKYDVDDSSEIKIIITELAEQLRDEKNREYLKFVYEYQEYIIPEIKLNREIEEKSEELISTSNEMLLKLHRVDRKLELVGEKNEEVGDSMWSWWLGSSLGLLMMAIGFRLWYTKVQQPLDIKLANEAGRNGA